MYSPYSLHRSHLYSVFVFIVLGFGPFDLLIKILKSRPNKYSAQVTLQLKMQNCNKKMGAVPGAGQQSFHQDLGDHGQLNPGVTVGGEPPDTGIGVTITESRCQTKSQS